MTRPGGAGAISLLAGLVVWACPLWAQVAVPPPVQRAPRVPARLPQALPADRFVAIDPQRSERSSEPVVVRGNDEVPASLLAELDAPDLKTREGAAQRLGALVQVGTGSIERALGKAALSAEQRQRLIGVGYEIFKSTPRGAMGVQFEFPTAAGVTVRPVQAGFDSVRVLKEGDAIRAIDGRRVEDQDEIRIAIISREPGESLPLTIVRDGVPIETSVKLGSYADLRNSQGLDDSVLSAAWAAKVVRLAGTGGQAPVMCGISGEQWASSARRQLNARLSKREVTNDPFTGEQVRSALPKPIIAALAMGGQVRDQVYRAAKELAGMSGGVRIFAGNEIIILPDQRGRGRANQAGRDPGFRNALLEQRQAITSQKQQIVSRMNDRSISVEARAKLNTELVRLSTQEEAIQQEINELFRQP